MSISLLQILHNNFEVIIMQFKNLRSIREDRDLKQKDLAKEKEKTLAAAKADKEAYDKAVKDAGDDKELVLNAKYRLCR